jgi:hypothetical protein
MAAQGGVPITKLRIPIMSGAPADSFSDGSESDGYPEPTTQQRSETVSTGSETPVYSAPEPEMQPVVHVEIPGRMDDPYTFTRDGAYKYINENSYGNQKNIFNFLHAKLEKLGDINIEGHSVFYDIGTEKEKKATVAYIRNEILYRYMLEYIAAFCKKG